MTASYGSTRSFRNDYLDATYARLAHEAFRLWGEFEAQTGTDVLVRCGCMNIAKRSVTPDLAGTYAQMSHEMLTEVGLSTESLDGDDVRAALPLPRRGHGAARRRRRRRRPARRDRRADARARRARGRARSRASRRRRSSATATSIRVRTDAGEYLTRSLVVTAGTAPTTSSPGCPAAGCRSRSRRTGRARPSTSSRPRRARALHGGRDAGDRLPRHRDLLPPDRRGARRRREDRLLQPARHAAGRARASTASPSFIEQCMPGLRDAAVRDVRTSTSATTTSSPTTTSCSARSRASRTPSSASAGAAPATSSRPGSGACSPTSPRDGTDYDIDRFDPARSRKGGRHR